MTKGERLRTLREKAGLHQIEAAERLGVSKQTLYKYEKDIVTNIPSDMIERMASLYCTSPAYIFGWDIEFIPDEVHIERAEKLYEAYASAAPEVQAAIDLLLKSSRPDS